jgi:hypothetical protein
MKFTMPIDKTVATRVGHTIDFKAGVPTHVPKEAWREVQEAGAVPEDQVAAQAARSAKADDAVVIDDPVERRNRIFDAFTQMIERNKRGDFGASNAPHQKVVESIVGFEIKAQERDALWTEFQQLASTGESPPKEKVVESVAEPQAKHTPAADKPAKRKAKAKA